MFKQFVVTAWELSFAWRFCHLSTGSLVMIGHKKNKQTNRDYYNFLYVDFLDIDKEKNMRKKI